MKNALKYGRESVKTNVIISALKTRELEIQSSHKENQSGDGLFVRGKSQNNQGKNSNKPFSSEETKAKQKKKCKYCKKKGHLIQECFFLKRKNQ